MKKDKDIYHVLKTKQENDSCKTTSQSIFKTDTYDNVKEWDKYECDIIHDNFGNGSKCTNFRYEVIKCTKQIECTTCKSVFKCIDGCANEKS